MDTHTHSHRIDPALFASWPKYSPCQGDRDGRGRLMWLHPTTDWAGDSFVGSYHFHTSELCPSQFLPSGVWLSGFVRQSGDNGHTIKQNWPMFPTQDHVIALVIKYWVHRSSRSNSWHIKTAWHGLEQFWENFIYFSSPSEGLFHFYVYLFEFFFLKIDGGGQFESK